MTLTLDVTLNIGPVKYRSEIIITWSIRVTWPWSEECDGSIFRQISVCVCAYRLIDSDQVRHIKRCVEGRIFIAQPRPHPKRRQHFWDPNIRPYYMIIEQPNFVR